MTSYTAPAEFWTNVGQIASGPSGDMANQIAVPIGETDIEMGMICSLNASGQAVKGLETGTCMPLWSVNANEEATYDVWNDGRYAASDIGAGLGIGGMINLVAGNGGIELFSNQYKAGQTYTAGRTQLTNCTTAADGASNLGKVKPASATVYNDAPVVGCVSRGVSLDKQIMPNGRNVLYFWPVYQPPVAMAATT
jgi:hypothetical protein